MNEIFTVFQISLNLGKSCGRFVVFMVVNIQMEVFWVVMPCSIVVGTIISEIHAASIYEMKMEAEWTFETLVSTTSLHCVTTQKT
jgi:hypothetical protein